MRSAESEGVPQIEVQWYNDWIKENLPDQNGKVAIVTGSNSGTGFWCASALAGAGATVVLACRTIEKAEAAKKEILDTHKEAKVDVIRLDNADFDSVRSFAKTFDQKYDRLDILCNNAGVMALPYSLTKDGYEIQFQTNHLAHFQLTKLLWKKIVETPGQSRVVQHSSSAHHFGKPYFSPDHMEKPQSGWTQVLLVHLLIPLMGYPKWNWLRYGVSKLSNVLFMRGLQTRIDDKDLTSKVISVACHPGYASTGLQYTTGETAGAMPGWKKMNQNYAQSAADGSLPLLMACAGEGVANGDFLGPMGRGNMTGPPGKNPVKGYGDDPRQREELWKYSEECTGDKFDV